MATLAQLWKTCAQVAVQLDAEQLDWHILTEIAATLDRLAGDLDELVQEAAIDVGMAEHLTEARAAMLPVGKCMQWVKQHQYDALETQLWHKLDLALQSAIATLDVLEYGAAISA